MMSASPPRAMPWPAGPITSELVMRPLILPLGEGHDCVGAAGAGAGQAITVRGLPPVVGVIGKDRRTISITHQRMQVETISTVLADGTVRETPRVCIRERLLRKL